MAPTPSSNSGSTGTSADAVKSGFIASPRQRRRVNAADRMIKIVDQLRPRNRRYVEHRPRVKAEHDGQDHERRQYDDFAPADVGDRREARLLQPAEDHLAVEPQH